MLAARLSLALNTMTFPSRHLQRLTDPRWIAKRLEILAVRGNDCEGCDAKGEVVHVHHGFYEGDRYPWNYPDDSLHVLCPTCHGKAQALMVQMNRLLGTLTLEQYRDALEYVSRAVGVSGGCLVVAR